MWALQGLTLTSGREQSNKTSRRIIFRFRCGSWHVWHFPKGLLWFHCTSHRFFLSGQILGQQLGIEGKEFMLEDLIQGQTIVLSLKQRKETHATAAALFRVIPPMACILTYWLTMVNTVGFWNMAFVWIDTGIVLAFVLTQRRTHSLQNNWRIHLSPLI